MAIVEYSDNTKKVIELVNLADYYNTFIVPKGRIFKPVMDGRSVNGICPFHKDTDPSFHVWKSKNIFHCFGCGYSGDVVKVHRQLVFNYERRKLSLEESVKELAMHYNIELTEEGNRVESPFSIARRLLMDKDMLVKPKGMLTLSDIERENKKIERISRGDLSIKTRAYQDLDLNVSMKIVNNK